jgi:hypothetical protein
MMVHLRQFLVIPVFVLLALSALPAMAGDDEEFWAPTPPRLSYLEGDVSYWRQGSDDWVKARTNLPLAEGDALYVGRRASVEVQFDNRSFVRANESSLVSLLNQDTDYLQFKVASGLVSLDIRNMSVGSIVEISTPNAVFIIEHPGYYRLEVNANTHFITRRGGRATLTTADGRSMGIYPSEEIVISGGDPGEVATYAAPDADAWDRWNDARTDRLGDSVSARYLPPDVYGAEDLDRHGYWRVVPTYGPVWIPHGVGPDWVPYSTGWWVWDPFYEWTWIDDAPWGWAPFHYGRWVNIDGYWAWAPGPVVRRAAYAPALVAFMVRNGDVSLRLGIGLPGLWWVALSWGEPVLPWWGPDRHRGHPRWVGWGGPRIVNDVSIRSATVINIGDIRFRNAALPRAVLTLPGDRFGREKVRATAEGRFRHEDFSVVHGNPPVRPSRESLNVGAAKGIEPPREVVSRRVVSTRTPRERALPWRDDKQEIGTRALPQPSLVKPPSSREREESLPRPTYAPQPGPERTPPPFPPRFGELRTGTPSVAPATGVHDPRRTPKATPEPAQPKPAAIPPRAPAARPSPGTQQVPSGAERSLPDASARRGELGQDRRPQALPGQPANQTYKGRPQGQRSGERR